jgi:DNA-nicking Smr family endonuclease
MSIRRRLSPEEQALWARVAATVTPFDGREVLNDPATTRHPVESRDPPRRIAKASIQPPMESSLRRDDAKRGPAPPPTDTLDGGWDRRLRRGVVLPDRTIDLHGHTLATAHAALDHALARAVADDIRVLLVVTGKPPRGEEKRRGLIRANIGDWLGSSVYASRIAAVRNAHPRHGGAGALYVILRRKRGG